jgi:two-component system, NarL family, invasion response regulator UvrY
MIRVAIIDDHPIVRRGLRDLLLAERDIVVVAEAGHPDEVVRVLTATPADVVLLDLSLPGRGGLELLGDLRREWPELRVLIVSTHAESQYAVRAIKAGAAGYIPKTAPAGELIAAVRNVAATGRHISEMVAAELAEYARRRSKTGGLASLSDREFQVLRLMAGGRSSGEIAERLSLSVKTVSTYRTRLLGKLHLRTVAELLRYAIEEGITD